ncbi:MAG: hypothetical protein R6U29_12235 [Desulfosudaceae bacterium]
MQLEKTASSHITHLLKKTVSGQAAGKHNRLPGRFRRSRRHVIGSIRNPWDWYLSLWSFGCRGRGGLYLRQTKRSVRGHGLRTHPLLGMIHVAHELVKSTRPWRLLYTDIDDALLFRKWLRQVMDPARKWDLGDFYALSPVSECAGFMTFRYLYLYSDTVRPLFCRGRINTLERVRAFDRGHTVLDDTIRVEELETDLIRILTACDIPLNDHQLDYIHSIGRTNVSRKQQEPGSYYDAETIELVRRKERLIIDKYKYSVPFVSD